MKVISIKEMDKYLTEYMILCNQEWGKKRSKEELEDYIKEKKQKMKSEEKVIDILALIENKIMIGFISLLLSDGDERKDLSPWYGTMYIKKEYRKNGYSKILNQELLKQAKKLGYQKVYLKSNLINYYEKFNAHYIETLQNKEKLYYIDLNEIGEVDKKFMPNIKKITNNNWKEKV